MEIIKKEKYIPFSPIPVFIEGIETILFQMKNCICKIYKKERNITGTGFFCKIPFQNFLLPVLITNNHVLNKEDLKLGNIIVLTLNNNKEKREIEINNKRKIITSENPDITIIELKSDDKIDKFLEIDNDAKNKNYNDLLELSYRSKSIYILHYPESKKIHVSFGLLNNIYDNEINHYCSTNEGTSGSPILSLETFKVIGIHYGRSNMEFNKGVFIQKAINEFNNQYKKQNQEKLYISKNIINIKYNKIIEIKDAYKKSVNVINAKNEKLSGSSKDSKSGKNIEIKLEREVKLEEIAYSLCYLKKYKLIALGMFRKIIFYEYTNFKFIMETNLLDDKIAYIYELSNGKILVINNSTIITILEINSNVEIIYNDFSTKNKRNFVGIELYGEKIICGGNQYLSIIEYNLSSGYSLTYSINLNSFINNLVELNSNLYLIGLSDSKKILIYSNNNNSEVCKINNINLYDNNYSITKISNDYVAIAGAEEEMKLGCIYILSINKMIICKKFNFNYLSYCEVTLKLNDNEFISLGGKNGCDSKFLFLLKYKQEINNFTINTIYEGAHSDSLEGIASINNKVFLTSDSSRNLKIWNLSI